MGRPKMLRVLLALLALFLGAGLARAANACADDGCGCPHEAPSVSCCCAGEVPAPAGPRPTREDVLAELRAGKLSPGPCLVDGGCRPTRRTRATVSVPGTTGLPVTLACTVRRAARTQPCVRPPQRPTSLEPEPWIPPPRAARA